MLRKVGKNMGQNETAKYEEDTTHTCIIMSLIFTLVHILFLLVPKNKNRQLVNKKNK